MSRRRAATATRPPDAFMEAYEAEAQEASKFKEGDRIRAQSNRGEAIEGIITSLGRTYAQLDNHKSCVALLEGAQLVKAHAVPEELLSLVGRDWNEQVDQLLEDHRLYSLNAWSGAKRSKSHATYKGWEIGFHKDAEFDITKNEYTWYAKRKDLPQVKGDKETLDYCHEAIDSVEERLAALAECLKPEPEALTKLLQEVAKDFEGGVIGGEVEPIEGFKVGDRVICRNHPNSMDDWQIEKILTKQALCYSPAIQQHQKINLADLEKYSPEKAFPTFKVGDRVEMLAYERYADEVFTVTSASYRNGMTSMVNKDNIGFSVHCSELRLLSGKLEIAPSAAPTHELATSDPLASLATAIKTAHGDCEQALTIARSAESSALEHAKRCGELLLEAKKANGHGGWEAWRNENTGIPSSTASLYQRVAERWDEVKGLKTTSLKAIDAHFRATKKQLKANPQPSADLPAQPANDDRQIIPAAKVAAIAQSGWIQTKDGQNLNPLHYRVEGAEDIKAETLIDEDEGEFTELLELDDELIAANLVIGDARATIEALLEQICFLPEDEGSIPSDPSNPYKGWQIATDSPNEGMIAICLYAPWGAWWALPTEEFFEYGDHDRAIEWAQTIIDRLEIAAERAEKPEPKAKKVKVGAGHLRAIAKDQSAAAFKLLSSLKGNMSEEIDLLGVADALEEAIMQVLEEWILGEEG